MSILEDNPLMTSFLTTDDTMATAGGDFLDFLSSPSPSAQSPQSCSSFDTDFDLDLSSSSPIHTPHQDCGAMPELMMMTMETSSSGNPLCRLFGQEMGSQPNSVVFEQLLETLHAGGRADQFSFLPMEGDEMLQQGDFNGHVGDSTMMLEPEDTGFLSSSSVDDAAAVSFEPTLATFNTLATTTTTTPASTTKSAPAVAAAQVSTRGRKMKPTPLALPPKSAPLASSLQESPPSSPLSSPTSESDSRSPSPGPENLAKGPLGELLSSKPTRVQIGKNVAIEISERDLVNFEVDQIAKIAGTKFTKAEEKELKRLRRKSRNKISAAHSRDKKKSYLSGLEERVDAVNSVNFDLKKRLQELERENNLLKGRVDFLCSHVEPSVRASLPTIAVADEADESAVSKSKQTPKSKSSSLLTAAHIKGKTSIKSAGVYLMLVFISFGIFFNSAAQNGPSLSTSSQLIPGAALARMDTDGLLQSSPAAGVMGKPFVVRKIHSYDESMMMDTIPMLDHLNEPNTTCDDERFWDAYYEADLSGVDFNERYKHEMVMWKDCPNTAYHTAPMSADLPVLDQRLSTIKAQLENHEAVDRVVCSSTMCLVRLEQNDIF